MLGAINLNRALQEDSQEYPGDNGGGDESPGYNGTEFKDSEILNEDEVISKQNEAQSHLREMEEYKHLKYILLPDDTIKLIWDMIILL
jgi:hypothetical protein